MRGGVANSKEDDKEILASWKLGRAWYCPHAEGRFRA